MLADNFKPVYSLYLQALTVVQAWKCSLSEFYSTQRVTEGKKIHYSCKHSKCSLLQSSLLHTATNYELVKGDLVFKCLKRVNMRETFMHLHVKGVVLAAERCQYHNLD